jgi:hypothetical protein
MKSFDKCFITGCDDRTEWMLPWFLKNYIKHNSTPIVLADFGMTDQTRAWAYQVSEFDDILDLQYRGTNKAWFLKPRALLEIKSEFACWIDTDIHILGDMSGVFNYVEEGKLAMVEDKPWSKRTGELWHNSGVVAVKGKPKILYDWEHVCRTRPVQGDQETLHLMLDTPLKKLAAVNSVPNIYNWLRVQILDGEDNPNKLAMHWTGFKGKNEIRKIMYHEKG